jgi:benzoate-CoA ligase family protein
MKAHEVQVNPDLPSDIKFAPVFNVSVPFLDRHLDEGRGDFVVARWRNRDLTLEQLARNVNRTANLLKRLGIKRGERVMMLLRDHPSFYYAFLGAVRIGAIPIPVNYFLRAADYAYMLTDSQAKAVFACKEAMAEIQPALGSAKHAAEHLIASDDAPAGWGNLDELIANESDQCEPAETTAETDCFWLYSSGSTGSPKASVHQHKDMIFTSQLYGVGVANIKPGDVMFSPAKLFFAYGLGNSLSFPLWIGATIVLLEEKPTAENTLETITRFKPSVNFGVPTLYAGQIAALENGYKADLSSLRFCPTGGEILPKPLLDKWKKRTGLDLYDAIGSSEVLHFYTSNRPGAFREGSAGQVVPGYEAKVLDDAGKEVGIDEVGQLWIRGESTAKYYWNKPEKTAESMREGWFGTGDMVRRDADGYYYFCGRGNDMLKVGGIWVSPSEMESALVGHASVLEAAVIGAPDENGLIKPKAFVVRRDGKNGGDAEVAELTSFLKNKLAPFKYPRWIRFVDELPKTASGKIQRFRLRDIP